MVILVKLIFILVLAFSWSIFADDVFEIKNVVIECGNDDTCGKHILNFKGLGGKKVTLKRLKEMSGARLLDDSVEYFSYELRETDLHVKIVPRKNIGKLSFEANRSFGISLLEKRFETKAGEPYFPGSLVQIEAEVRAYLLGLGYFLDHLLVSKKVNGGEVDIFVDIEISKSKDIREIKFKYNSNGDSIEELERFINKFKWGPWNATLFKSAISEMNKMLFDLGHLLSTIKVVEKREGDLIDLEVVVNSRKRVYFVFVGNKLFNQQQLRGLLLEYVRNNLSLPEKEEIEKIVNNAYEDAGLFNSSINVRNIPTREGIKNEELRVLITLEEGHKVGVEKVIFIGNEKIKLRELQEHYQQTASVLASRSFLDIKFLKRFRNDLRKKYLERGFVFSVIGEPYLEFDKKTKRATVKFTIKERQQCLIKEINIIGVSPDVKLKITEGLKNKRGKPVNIIFIKKDLERAVSIAKDSGFYFASLKYNIAKDVLSYSQNYSLVTMVLDFSLGEKVLFDSILVTGINKTKASVVTREVELKKGEIITPEKVNRIRENLSGLGLFSYSRVTPIYTGRTSSGVQTTDLLIQVKEKDFGTSELALGYRTDLGYKASAGVLYNNLLGMNHTISFKGEGNLRDSYRGYDAVRKSKEKDEVEFSTKLGYSIPYILPRFWGVRTDLNMQMVLKRKRFYSFDANIFKLGPSLSFNINKNLNFGLSYQFENIRQYDATKNKDNDSFQIGSITPTIALDFRDSSITPRSGAYFGLSWEFANPYFGSMSNDELEINYSKIVSRNKFYLNLYPVVFALSISAGIEGNNADQLVGVENGAPKYKGYIPTVKVFRLAGPDLVRGFEDGEVNLLESGEDISDVFVNSKAYFTNIKFEPRYFINDNTVIALFFDAGKVFVNHYRPIDLRASSGVSLKLLTPVGSLNFDYGVKLKRERLSGGARESFGKFHLSIGFF